MSIFPIARLYDPFLDVLGALVSNGRTQPRKQLCHACGETDYPRADYPTHTLWCRHCGAEIKWWLHD